MKVVIACVAALISLSTGVAHASDETDSYIQCSLAERGSRISDGRQIVSILAPLREGRFEFNEIVKQRAKSGKLIEVPVRLSVERLSSLVVRGEVTLFNPFKNSLETIPLNGVSDGEGNGYVFINLIGSMPSSPVTALSFGCAQVELSSIIDDVRDAEGVRILK